jgi:Family of unknown function (DUF6510)
MTDAMTWVDGNDLAGAAGELFAIDLTMARGQCATCGRQSMVAQAHVYNRAPGLVARCPGCEAVLMRLVRAPDRAWLDMRGLTYLEIPVAAPPA